MGIERGCGKRQKNGVYAVVETSPDGKPLEHFLLCPPRRLHPDLDVRVPAQGQVIIVGKDGEQGMLDHIGAKGYPNVADFLEEGRRFGFSFHIQASIARRLHFGAVALPLHPRAIVENWHELSPRWFKDCPKGKHPIPSDGYQRHTETDREQPWWDETYPAFHADPFMYADQMCSGYWWHNIEGGELLSEEADPSRLVVRRQMPAFTYYGIPAPDGMKPQYARAIIARLPIGRLEVIRGDEKGDRLYEELRILDAIDVLMAEE